MAGNSEVPSAFAALSVCVSLCSLVVLQLDFASRLVIQAGGAAGLSVDLVMYPLDTVKTRIQSQLGFVAAGGFRRIYAGISTVLIGSVPSGTYAK